MTAHGFPPSGRLGAEKSSSPLTVESHGLIWVLARWEHSRASLRRAGLQHCGSVVSCCSALVQGLETPLGAFGGPWRSLCPCCGCSFSQGEGAPQLSCSAQQRVGVYCLWPEAFPPHTPNSSSSPHLLVQGLFEPGSWYPVASTPKVLSLILLWMYSSSPSPDLSHCVIFIVQGLSQMAYSGRGGLLCCFYTALLEQANVLHGDV